VYDPVVKDLDGRNGHVHFADSVTELAEGADALVLVTEWDELRTLDFAELGPLMRTRVVVDGRNVLDADAAARHGFRFIGVGR
jgi:UDPglucose 6-dehydrogenase